MVAPSLDEELRRAVRDARGLEVVRELLSCKADPNAGSDVDQDSGLLVLAVQRNDLSLCRLLLAYQADPLAVKPEHVRNQGSNSLEAAKLVSAWGRGDVSSVLATLQALILEAAMVHDGSLLCMALASIDIVGGNAEQVATLVDTHQNTLLHLCAGRAGQQPGAKGDAAARLTARALLGWGLSAQTRNGAGETPVVLALRAALAASRPAGTPAAIEPVRALLEASADAESPSLETGETLLMRAVRAGDLGNCEVLLEFGANLMQKNVRGLTAVMLAAGQPDLLSHLRASLAKPQHAAAAPPKPVPMVFDDSSPAAQPAVKRAPASFSLSEIDGELNSAEGLMNQLDLEESYEDDWSADALAAANSSIASDADGRRPAFMRVIE